MTLLNKVIPAAMALAFAGAVQAEAKLYGIIDMSYGKNEVVDGPTAKNDFHSGGDDGQSQGNSTTRIGFKGSYDVDTDVKANFKFETNGITNNGEVNGPAFFNRQAWFGLSHPRYGEVRIGRQDSLPFQVMGQFDFNGQSNGATTAYSGVGVWATNRQSRSLQYIAPEFSGINIQVGYVPEGDNSEGGAPSATGDDDNTSAIVSTSVTYGMGDLKIGGAFESGRETLANPNAEDFTSVAVSYDFKVVKVMAGYTEGPGLFKGSDLAEGITLGISAPVGDYTVGAHYADADNTTGGVKTNTTALELFVNRKIFKNTYAYAESLSLDNETGTDSSSYAIGVIFVF